MDAKIKENHDKLLSSLDELIKVYRHLLQVVRKEKSILISADLDDLNENNKTKEAMLQKVRQLENNRSRFVTELALALSMKTESPSLTEIAVAIGGPEGEKLQQVRFVLDLLLKRVQEHNKENEVLIQSALQNITGAMDAIRTTLQDKNTYQKKGAMSSQPTPSGALVSKEV